MKSIIYALIIIVFASGCKEKNEILEDIVNKPYPHTNDSVAKPAYEGYDGDRQVEDTRIVYPDFELVFHGFAGYDVDREKGVLYDNPGDVELRLADGDIPEALIAKKDTIVLGEFPEYSADNKLLEIIPKNRDDKFKVSMYYKSSLDEVFNNRELNLQEIQKAYKNADKYKEVTKEIALNDSLNFFRTITLESSTDEAFEKEKKSILDIATMRKT